MIRLSRITNLEEADIIRRHTGEWDLSKMVICGFIPAQILEYATVISIQTKNIECSIDKFARVCLSGLDGGQLPYDLVVRSIFYQDILGYYRWCWTPIWIVRLLQKLGGSFLYLWEHYQEAMFTDHKQLEVLVAIAIILRRLSCQPKFMTQHKCDLSTLGFYRIPRGVPDSDSYSYKEIKSLEILRQELRGATLSEDLRSYTHVVMIPSHLDFQLYDVLEAHKVNDVWEVISGYQVKLSDKPPSGPALLTDASWLISMRSSPTLRANQIDGFTKLNLGDIERFLGFSLWQCAESLWNVHQGKFPPDD